MIEKKIFKAKNGKNGANIQASLLIKTLDLLKIENLDNGESIILRPNLAVNLALTILEYYKHEGWRHIPYLNDVDVPEGYVLLLKPFFGLPPGALLEEYEKDTFYMPREPYVIEYKDYNFYFKRKNEDNDGM